MHLVARTLLAGSCDAESPLFKLDGQADLLGRIWRYVILAWAHELLEERISTQSGGAGDIAFAHVDNVSFPQPKGRNVNMMPFVLGDRTTLPEELHDYWPMIATCLETLPDEELLRVGYLTVHESEVPAGASQRRGGLHTEGFVREACDASGGGGGGRCRHAPDWHRWGLGRAMDHGRFEGGIFLASTLSDTTQLYNVRVPPTLVGRGGDLEHLRPTLERAWPGAGQPRHLGPKGGAAGNAHEVQPPWPARPARHPIQPQASQLFWLTDSTPHESLPLAAGARRQFFRLVTSAVDVWYAAHASPNPLGVLPACKVVSHDKFTGKAPLFTGKAPLFTGKAPPAEPAAAAPTAAAPAAAAAAPTATTPAAPAAPAAVDMSRSAVLRRMARSRSPHITRIGCEGLSAQVHLRKAFRALQAATQQAVAEAAAEAAGEAAAEAAGRQAPNEEVCAAQPPRQLTDLPSELLEAVLGSLLEDLTCERALARLGRCCKALRSLVASAELRLSTATGRALGVAAVRSYEQLAVLQVCASLGTTCVYFQDAGAAFRPGSSLCRIDSFADLLRRHPRLLLRVDAHAGARAPPHFAGGFSLERARAVGEALLQRGADMERVSLHGWGKRVAERALWASGCYESRRAEVYFELDGVELPARPAHYEGAGVAERTYLERCRTREDDAR